MKDFNKSFSLLNDILRNRLSNDSLITHKKALVATFAAERITERQFMFFHAKTVSKTVSITFS